MTNPLTAERAREIAHATLVHLEGRTDREYEYAVGDEKPFALALIDQRIEMLEACAIERCPYCRRWPLLSEHQRTTKYSDEALRLEGTYYRHGNVDCLVQFEQREIARLRAEREKLKGKNA